MITFDLEIYWFVVGAIATVLAGAWAFRRSKGLLSGR